MSLTETLATEYMVTALPVGHSEAHYFAVYVQWRGDDRYVVSRHHNASPNDVLNADAEWEWEPRPSERDDEFIARTRFDLATALRMAQEAAPKVTVNGWTPAGVLARRPKTSTEEV